MLSAYVSRGPADVVVVATTSAGGLRSRLDRLRLPAGAWLALFGVGVWLLARLGTVALKRADLPGAAWWPAAGLAVVVLLRTSRRWWPWLLAAVAAAVVLNNLQAGTNLASCAFLAAANVVECTITAALFRGRRAQSTELLCRGTDALRLSVAALCGVSVASGIIALRGWVLGWVLGGGVLGGGVLRSTGGYAVSHCLGLLMFTPLLLLVPKASSVQAELRAWRVNAEWGAQLALSVGTAWWVFFATARLPIAFMVIFPLLWGAMRLGPVRAMASTVAVSLIVTVGTLHDRGPFVSIADPAHRLWVFQLLLAAISVAVLALVLSAHARSGTNAALAEREASLAQAQRLARLGSWTWDLGTDELEWSPELFTITGTDPATHRPSFGYLQDMMLPEDRDQVAAKVAQAKAIGQPYEVDYRIQRPDGRLVAIHGRVRTDCDRHGTPVRLRGIAQDVTEARTAAHELARARDLFASVLNSATEQIIIGTDLAGLVTVFNVGAERILGYRAADMIGRLPMEIWEPAQIADRAAELGIPAGPGVFVHALKNGAQAETRQWAYHTQDGRTVQVMLTATAMRDSAGVITGYIGVGSDVSEQRRTEHALADSEQRFRLAFETSSVGMYLTDLDPARPGQILRANQAMADLVGIPAAKLAGQTVLDITHPIDLGSAQGNLEEMTSGRVGTIRREKAFRHANGDVVWAQLSLSRVESDGERYVVALAEDITARKHAEDALRHQSLHDPLTGLANRSLFRDRLEHALAASTRSARPVGVLYIDLDGFKQVNDNAGHGAGDELLIVAAGRLSQATRPGDTVGRLGGDEFAILCPDLVDSVGLQAVAERVLHTINTVFPLAAGHHRISASVGVALSDEFSTVDSLLALADAGMYSAKKAGKNRVCATPVEDQARAARAVRLSHELHTAVEQNQLVMHGQPIIDLATETTVAVETLIRWQHPARGLLPPAEFLDIAEHSTHLVAVGQRVLAESARLAASWAELLGPAAPDVHVNIFGRQLEAGNLAAEVRKALAHYAVPANKLVLELTESHLLALTNSARADLKRLREQGVRIAVDDLGAGLNGVAGVADLPVDILKIDLSCVAGLGQDARCDAIARAILSLGRNLGLSVVAEGVETPQQAQLLRDYGCDTAQGYLFSPPRPENQLRAHLLASAQRSHRTRVG